MKATILDLRRRMSEIFKALDRNETVTILHRGRRKGILYPAGSAERKSLRIAESAAFGMWKNRRDLRNVDAAVRRARKGRLHAL
jgi:hypothetical protein